MSRKIYNFVFVEVNSPDNVFCIIQFGASTSMFSAANIARRLVIVNRLINAQAFCVRFGQNDYSRFTFTAFPRIQFLHRIQT